MKISELGTLTPVRDRQTDEVVMEVGRLQTAGLTELVQDGDEDACWMLTSLFAEYIYGGGHIAQFVLGGEAMTPHVHVALGHLLDKYFDAVPAVIKVEEAVEELTPALEKMERDLEGSVTGYSPYEPRVEMRQIYRGGEKVDAWLIMSDTEVFAVHETAEEAQEALPEYAIGEAPRPDHIPPEEEYVPHEDMKEEGPVPLPDEPSE